MRTRPCREWVGLTLSLEQLNEAKARTHAARGRRSCSHAVSSSTARAPADTRPRDRPAATSDTRLPSRSSSRAASASIVDRKSFSISATASLET